MRVQLVAALLLGLVLVASGLYLWRRPPAGHDAAGAELAGASSGEAAAASGAPVSGAAAFPIGLGDAGIVLPGAIAVAAVGAGPSLSEARVLVCQDRGRKKTAPDQCDHVALLEQAFSGAISKAGTCATSSSGTIEYVADVSFARHKVNVSLPRSGRSVRDRKILRACSTAVRGAMKEVPLDGMGHEHARYKIAVTATYKGP